MEDKIRELIDQLHASAAVAAFGGSTAPERDPVSLLPPAKGEVDKAVLEYVTTVTPVGAGWVGRGTGRLAALHTDAPLRRQTVKQQVTTSRRQCHV